ncbi:MAG: choice-of-anchor V domain-containing protein [Bacteroidia bacterium]
MKNKIKVISAIALTAISSIVFIELSSPAGANGGGAPSARTGSPGDGGNCTSCHNGTATTQAGLITSDIPLTGYVPGTTYTITASITTNGVTEYGFQISPQSTSGALLGTLTATNTAGTQLTTSGKYITHKSAGTAFPSGTATWSFDWTAPVAGTGDVTFYGAFNSANSNNNTAGDIITLSSLTASENLTTDITNKSEETIELSVYPNPFTDKLYIKNALNNTEVINVTISDINGKIVKSTTSIKNEQAIDLQELAKGLYSIKIETNKGIITKKVTKE